jgi:hypothetical protein
MRARVVVAFGAVVVVVALARCAGCDRAPFLLACAASTDCAKGFACVDDACVPAAGPGSDVDAGNDVDEQDLAPERVGAPESAHDSTSTSASCTRSRSRCG